MSLVDVLLLVLLTLILVLLLLVWARLRRPAGEGEEALGPLIQQSSERLDRGLRDELSRSATGTRQELLATLAQFQQSLLHQGGDVARTQNEQIDSFRVQLAKLQEALSGQALAAREAQDAAGARLSSTLSEQLQLLGQRQEQRLTQVQAAVDQRLTAIQQDNEKKLEQMRATVDEKLQATLEQRLGESFKQVAERLEQVYRGLGEMQNLARDVGSLNRVLSNVKTRGIFGEVQLAGLLEQVFTPEQYAANVATLPGSSERVEFAIRLPGQRDDGQPLWLPIDAKFPREDYERLLEAQDRADAPAAEAAAKAIESRLRLEARTIREKYVAPPHTTDFAILFVPTEGLYAEALRRPGLVEALQREHKVMLCGPTTLLATLSSLQMGFRTLALEKRSAEVWEVLGAVKTEFGKFGEVLAKTKKKLEEAANTIDSAEVRTRAMTRKLKTVEALPDESAAKLLALNQATDDDEAQA
ncbi:DNA recombination protein RmuC [Roseateles sp. DAIF2]|uniref:DNA recombination protein RmuC n=1 Tax=Roseateles sp. DAIF2 TaxID=2714952 RepID=UPI0018A26CA0|nr:DNA recombination protein RmuC [Roseateles sp. DAIF2]QPF72836.1 DNA recombination protein RmuC [Roseateles sp. DAIF2]